ncbi:MAG TPA: glycoside hydrolase family 2 TIM barrel-domain containing protein, partial [Oleiagrimonas sp.]|nr:glycoside hydrolase family 2 TIM barrel-domain containing protein [Oleiagrimonas sp.]
MSPSARRPVSRSIRAAMMLIIACLFSFAVTAKPSTSVPATVAGGAGSAVPIGHWQIQSAAKAQEGGQAISQPQYSTDGWYPVNTAHATVIAGLMQSGRYAHIFHADNMRQSHYYEIPWWYRSTFKLPAGGKTLHTFIRVNGIIPRADLWLNGTKIADHTQVTGAYTTHMIDVTDVVRPGTNVLAVHVHHANPQRDLSIGWIDWTPAPPADNMGIWRNVDIVRSGAVSVHGLHVTSKLALPGLKRARLTLEARVRNDSAAPRDVLLRGHVAGVALQRRVHLAAGQTRTVTFNPNADPALVLTHPEVWWPAQWGDQPLYEATLKASIDGTLSDRATTTFGIRSVSSHLTDEGYRQFVINGHPLLIRGGGWSSDLFLRDRPERLAAQFRYIRNLGLNTIRLEGRLERPDFYRLADRMGILILAGWECCNKWEAWAGSGGEPWDKADFRTARKSMISEARRLRNHPSVIAFLIGSDNAPPDNVANMYVDALHAADWQRPIIASASAQSTTPTGPSGMKMSGPYAWVPPGYWYADQRGGAFGFNSETSAGADIPRPESVRDMLSPLAQLALWKYPEVRQYHAARMTSPFASLQRFSKPLAARYGKPKNLADYVAKAQLANYASVRAQFEAYNARMNADNLSTGVIYWMLNSAWPSLHWQLIPYDLNPAGAYFGAKKANEPVHIQYSYDDRSIMGINHTLEARHDLDARIRVRNLNGEIIYQHRVRNVDLPANHATRITAIPELANRSSTWFVELDLTGADGKRVSRNV